MKKVEQCKECPLFERPLVKSEIIGENTQDKYIWIIGEAPGYTEVKEKKPFVGKAGQLLRNTLKTIGYNGYPTIITNACLCHPPNNATPTKKAINSCKFHIDKLYEMYPPKVIIGLGKTAARCLNLPDIAMKNLRGEVYETQYGPCLITYHPSKILRTQYRYKGIFIEDLRKALAIIKNKTEKIIKPNIIIIKEKNKIIDFLNSLLKNKNLKAIDIETSLPKENGKFNANGLDPYHPNTKLYSIAIAYSNKTYAFPVDLLNEKDSKEVKQVLKQALTANNNWIAHNIVFETKMLKKFLKINPQFTHDTMILAYLLKEDMQGFYSLEELVKSFFPGKHTYKNEKEDLLTYNAKDAFYCLSLYNKLQEEISNLDKEQQNAINKAEKFILTNIVPVVAEMELTGIKIHPHKLQKSIVNIKKPLELIQKKLFKYTNIANPRSEDFKKKIYELYEYEPILTKKGNISTNKKTLVHIFNTTENKTLKKIILLKLTHNALDKIYNTYLSKYPDFINSYTGRIHPSYHIVGTKTGRLSCSNPNFQQIPREGVLICPNCLASPLSSTNLACPWCGNKNLTELVKLNSIIVPEQGNIIISADYSQIEVRIMAHLSNDEKLIEALNKNLDIHSFIASQIYELPYEKIKTEKDTNPEIKNMRQSAKSIVFGLIYGMTPHGLAERLNIAVDQAQEFMDKFFKRFPGIKNYIDIIYKQVEEKKYVISEIGRIRRFLEATHKDLRQAQNFPVQSYASDLTLAAAYITMKTCKKYNIPAKIICMIHDNIKVETKKEFKTQTKNILTKTMTKIIPIKFNLKVPLDVDIEEISDTKEV